MRACLQRADVREVVSRTRIDLLMMQQGGTMGHVGQGTFRGVETVLSLSSRKSKPLGGFQRTSGVFLSWRGEVRRTGIPGRMMDGEAGRDPRGNFSFPYSQYTRRAQQA